MSKRNKKKYQVKEYSSKDNSFVSSFRNDGRYYDSNRFGRSHYFKYDKYSYQSFKNKRGNFRKKETQRLRSRPQSPVLGTQEYMEKKIEQTSAIIMRHLLNPGDTTLPKVTNEKTEENIPNSNPANEKELEKSVDIQTNSNKNKKKLSSKEVEEIHMRIMSHLGNLNEGRKRNLINSNSTGYDTTIQHFVKQQRLEISRALRHMCSSNQFEDPNELISSIIPDIGIKIEDLPRDVIEELSHTFGCDFNGDISLDSYENYSLKKNINTVPELHQIEKRDSSPEMEGSIFQDDPEKEEKPNIKNENQADNDVYVIENVNDVIEIDDTEDVVDSIEVKNVMDLGEVSIQLVKTEDEQNRLPPTKVVDALLIKPESDDIPRKEDEVILKEDVAKDNSVDVKEELDQNNVNLTTEENKQLSEDAVHNLESDPKEEVTSKVLEIKQIDKIIAKEDCSTQTDLQENPLTIDLLLEKNFGEKPLHLSDAIATMIQIDQWVAKLTKFRQEMFEQFVDNRSDKNDSSGHELHVRRKKNKKRKLTSDTFNDSGDEVNSVKMSNDCVEEITFDDIDDSSNSDSLMKFAEIDDVITVIKLSGDKLLAGSESGKIYICSIKDGKFIQVLSLQSGVPVTSLILVKEGLCDTNVYIGTFRDNCHVYNFNSYHFLKTITVPDSIQCMDTKWGYIFIGCVNGWLQRYCIERDEMEFEERFNDGTILALKATVEGPRRILIVASEESPLCIRDAMNGLHLRVLAKLETSNNYFTRVHSLIIDQNLVYCGTNKGDLLILSFHKGTMIQSTKVPGVPGKIQMKIYRNVLFIGRDKDIHLYDLKTNTFIGDIKGPGGCILVMDIVRNQLVLGTNARKFTAIPIDWSTFKKKH